jgi:hypothetical protein
MPDDQLDDLKQFITATVSQATAELPTRDEVRAMIQEELVPVRQSLAGLDVKVDTIADAQAQDNQDLELRVIKLEQRTA